MTVPAARDSSLDEQQLLPPPLKLERQGELWCPGPMIGISAPDLSAQAPGFRWLAQSLAPCGIQVSVQGSSADTEITCELDSMLASEAYNLHVHGGGASLRAGSAHGLQHGLATLAQWIRLAADTAAALSVGGVLIVDEPGLQERGVMLDVARGKRPTLEVLKDFVDRLAFWKINRFQLYMEADFAFSDASAVLEDRSPYTPQEIRSLDQFARERHVQLVPNQQSFGHLHAWLRHPQWNSLAEVPEGVEHPFSKVREPFSLAANDPRSFQFVEHLYNELLPCFSSDLVNVGLDETFDLGLGASKALCEERGKAQVYVEYLNRIHGMLTQRGKRMQYWGDIVLKTPELIPQLPRDATAMVWGYEPDFPFEEQLPLFAASGLPFQVCPGTSSWNSLGGRVASAFGNLRKAARCASESGAQGILITDWGDRGHLQPWPIAEFGWTLGAACAWNPEQAENITLEQVRDWLDRWAFEDSDGVMGEALIALGSTQEFLHDQVENGHALFMSFVLPDEALPSERLGVLNPVEVERVIQHVSQALGDLDKARPLRSDGELILEEMRFARDGLLLAGQLLRARLDQAPAASWRDLPAAVLAPLRERNRELLGKHRALWAKRFRPGGLASSLEWLNVLGEA